MKYFVNSKKVSLLLDLGYEIETYASTSVLGDGKMYIHRDSKGAIFELDELFATYCKLAYGFMPFYVTDKEYADLISDKHVYFKQKRTIQLNELCFDKP